MNEIKAPKVLFAVWELEPFLKVGGLGVVARSLPRALSTMGVDIAVVIPDYKGINFHYQRKRQLGTLKVNYGRRTVRVDVSEIKFMDRDIPVYLLGNKKYFDKPIDDTFAVFDSAVVELIKSSLLGDWKPEIVHCNDNHCGLIPLLLKLEGIKIKTLLTIHCAAHQRKSPSSYATNLGIPKEKLSLIQWETKNKQLNFLLEGIKHADWVNTVSKTYLDEIQTEEMGSGLDDVIRANNEKMSAIVNGIDYDLRNPAINQALAVRYSVDDIPGLVVAKQANKALLQEKFGLPVRDDVTVIGFVGRLDVNQKGIDILHRMIWREQFDHCQFVIMGHGKESWEERFGALSTFLPQSVAVVTKYDDDLASLIYAGSDYILIPSHFEPCCLIQMYAMLYGAIPIARATGGLNDTIRDGFNGYLYREPTARALKGAIEKALTLKKNNPKQYQKMVVNAMTANFSWDKSARQYIELYKKLI